MLTWRNKHQAVRQQIKLKTIHFGRLAVLVKSQPSNGWPPKEGKSCDLIQRKMPHCWLKDHFLPKKGSNWLTSYLKLYFFFQRYRSNPNIILPFLLNKVPFLPNNKFVRTYQSSSNILVINLSQVSWVLKQGGPSGICGAWRRSQKGANTLYKSYKG